jgi:hypothetical protein
MTKAKATKAAIKKQAVKKRPAKKQTTKAIVKRKPRDMDKSGQFNIESLISQAIDKGMDFPIEMMERLLVMRRELKAEAAREEFFLSLSKFQAEIPEIKKIKSVNDKHGNYRYSYASLDDILKQVKQPLKNNGFSHTIKTEQTPESVTAICRLHHISGHTEETPFTIPIDFKAYMNIAQKVASALTYAKRYAFCDVTGIMTSDLDDDARSSGDVEQTQNGQTGQSSEVKTDKTGTTEKGKEDPIDYEKLIKNEIIKDISPESEKVILQGLIKNKGNLKKYYLQLKERKAKAEKAEEERMKAELQNMDAEDAEILETGFDKTEKPVDDFQDDDPEQSLKQAEPVQKDLDIY